jgi:hypothetical protein
MVASLCVVFLFIKGGMLLSKLRLNDYTMTDVRLMNLVTFQVVSNLILNNCLLTLYMAEKSMISDKSTTYLIQMHFLCTAVVLMFTF